jgi:hypothetical protein
MKRNQIDESEHPQEKWPLWVYNYWLDAETYIDKLKAALVAIKRENEYFYKENQRLALRNSGLKIENKKLTDIIVRIKRKDMT